MNKVLLVSLLLLVSACAEPPPAATPPPPYKPVGDTKQLMALVLEPAADVIWDSAGTIMTMEGEEDLSPTTDEGWLAVQHSAAVVAETGNLLMMPGRAQDAEDWVEISQGLIAVGEKARAAAEAQDKEALFDAGGEIYQVCLSCHQIYWTEPVEP